MSWNTSGPFAFTQMIRKHITIDMISHYDISKKNVDLEVGMSCTKAGKRDYLHYNLETQTSLFRILASEDFAMS